jgi:hypothetical protein
MQNQIFKIILQAILAIMLLSPSLAQELKSESKTNKENQKTEDLSKTDKILNNDLGANSVVSNTIKSTLLNNKPISLMFDDKQTSNIDRAIESLKNNQPYVADGNSDEQKVDKKNEDEKDKIMQEKENEKSYIYLGSMIYLSPKIWSVWINNKKITYETNSKNNEFYILSIQKDRVKVLWKLSLSKWKILSKNLDESQVKINENNQVEIEFELKTNQTFVLSKNSAIEGRPKNNSAKNSNKEQKIEKIQKEKPEEKIEKDKPQEQKIGDALEALDLNKNKR